MGKHFSEKYFISKQTKASRELYMCVILVGDKYWRDGEERQSMPSGI